MHVPFILEIPLLRMCPTGILADTEYVETYSFHDSLQKRLKQPVSVSICCCSVAQLCLSLCDPMDCSMSAFPFLHHLPEYAETHVHRVDDVIQPSDPLSSPSPPAFNLSQHEGPFQ